MDWKLFVQLLTTFVVAGSGWWVAHYFSSRRDLANERRKLRISYLLEAYRKLAEASDRSNPTAQQKADLESAITDIQLLGTVRQAQLAKQFADSMAAHQIASTDNLLHDLRQSLRFELKIEALNERAIFLRFTDKP